MHDPNKGNYWFGRKYFYLTGDNKDSCPSKLTQGATGNFVNNKGTTESNFKVECKN